MQMVINTLAILRRVSERALGSNDPLIEAMSWGISELIENGVSVGLIALGREGAGVGFSNTDMPWAEWHG